MNSVPDILKRIRFEKRTKKLSVSPTVKILLDRYAAAAYPYINVGTDDILQEIVVLAARGLGLLEENILEPIADTSNNVEQPEQHKEDLDARLELTKQLMIENGDDDYEIGTGIRIE